MNGAELFVRALENEGVEKIFGIPGEENLFVVEALQNLAVMLGVRRSSVTDVLHIFKGDKLIRANRSCIKVRN